MDVAKRYGEGSEMLVFLGKRGRKPVYRQCKTGTSAVANFENSTDSGAMVFLVRKGPLG